MEAKKFIFIKPTLSFGALWIEGDIIYAGESEQDSNYVSVYHEAGRRKLGDVPKKTFEDFKSRFLWEP